MTDSRTPEHLLAEPRWYATFTRARAEKQVSARLQRCGIESYLPLLPMRHQWKDRMKTVEVPLFPSYVFARFTLRDVHTVLTVPGISTIVRANGLPAPIPDDELRNVQAFISAAAAAQVQSEPGPMVQEGEWVEVEDGPFKGVLGRAIERRGRKRMLVGLSAVGQGMEVDIDTRLLRVVPRPDWATS
jgi:transcription antitermination factor NusG